MLRGRRCSYRVRHGSSLLTAGVLVAVGALVAVMLTPAPPVGR